MLSTLSVELLQEIGNELGKIDQQRLRAVAKDVGLAINPLFFSSLTLKTNELRLESSVDMLTLLASRKTGWSCYARSLNITVWHSRSQPAQMDGQKSEKEDVRKRLDLSDDAMGSLLASALGSMTNICSVSWWASNSDPAWQRAPFLGFLASAPSLEDLHLHTDDSEDLSLPLMTSLRKLNITTPYWKNIPLVENVPHLVKQNRGLISLHPSGYSALPEVWKVFQEFPDWHLKDISAKYSAELAAYLCSYSGIVKLHLEYPDEGDPNAFYHNLLPRHAATLMELSCSAGYECPWSFSSDFADELSKLQRLTSLEMSINEADIAAPANAVEHLLRTAATLPALRSLTIRSANAQSNRNARCGNPAMQHRSAVHEALTTAVQNFRTKCMSLAVVYVGFNRFGLKPADESGSEGPDGVLAYKLIPNPGMGSRLFFL